MNKVVLNVNTTMNVNNNDSRFVMVPDTMDSKDPIHIITSNNLSSMDHSNMLFTQDSVENRGV